MMNQSPTSADSIAVPAQMLQNPQAKQMLTQAGVSNFSQHLITTQTMLQQLMQRLYYARNQVQVQAQGQLRELQRLESQVGQTLQQLQMVQQAAQADDSGSMPV